MFNKSSHSAILSAHLTFVLQAAHDAALPQPVFRQGEPLSLLQ